MVRIIVIVLGLFVLWMLFGSKFSRQRKIVLSVAAILLAALGVWYESQGKTLRDGLIETSELETCGVSTEHSYRSNYNITFCFKNNASEATAKRLRLKFIAEKCTAGDCEELDVVIKELSVEIPPGESADNTVNLAFDKLVRGSEDARWRVEPIEVKATK